MKLIELRLVRLSNSTRFSELAIRTASRRWALPELAWRSDPGRAFATSRSRRGQPLKVGSEVPSGILCLARSLDNIEKQVRGFLLLTLFLVNAAR